MPDETGSVERALRVDTSDERAGPDPEFGIVDPGDGPPLVAATGPLVLVPALGLGRAGRLAVHWLVGGAAVSGLDPASLALSCTLPPGTTDATVERIWRGVDAAAEKLEVAIVTGHTARYDGCGFPVAGAGTAMATGDADAVVVPGGASPGDRLVVTTGPATGALLLSAGADDVSDKILDARIEATSVVRDARVAAATGRTTAMATATIRGVDGTLARLARESGAGVVVERHRIPDCVWARAACDRAGIDPWRASSPGTLVAAVDPDGVDAVLDALADAGIPAAVAGRVVDGAGVTADGEPVDPPGSDPLWTSDHTRW